MVIDKVIRIMVEYFGRDRHLIAHSLKVYACTRTIAISENIDIGSRKVLCIAAVLHDIGIPESIRVYGSADGEYHEILGAQICDELLTMLGFSKSFIDHVKYLVSNHHSYRDGQDPLLQILLEATTIIMFEEGDYSDDNVRGAIARHFRTRTGRELLNSMYGLLPVSSESLPECVGK